MTEYVIRGNSAILKCSIPSYIAEFVTVDAWIRDDGETYVQHLTTFNQGINIFWSKIILYYFTKACITNNSFYN